MERLLGFDGQLLFDGVLTAVNLLILFFAKRTLIWLSVPITVAVDALVWGPAVIHGGSYSAIALVFLVPQVLVVTAISFLIARRWANRAK